MEKAHRIMLVWGGSGDGGLYLFRLFLLFLSISLLVLSVFRLLFNHSMFIYINRNEELWGEPRHLAGSPGGGGIFRSCLALFRVHSIGINSISDSGSVPSSSTLSTSTSSFTTIETKVDKSQQASYSKDTMISSHL